MLSDGILSESCQGIASESSSFAVGEVCKGSGSLAGGYAIATFNPSFSGAATCDVTVADGNADSVTSYDTLGPADGLCRSGHNGMFSSVSLTPTGNVDFRFNCDNNCSSCELDLSDMTPDQCIILYSNDSQIVAFKVWNLADIGTCDASKQSIVILIVVIIGSVFGFIFSVAIVRILYTRQHVLKSSLTLFLTHLIESAADIKDLIRNRNLASRLKSSLIYMMVTTFDWLWQCATSIFDWFRMSFGWRLSGTREEPMFGDLVQFIMVCLCGAMCKWWSDFWMVRNYGFFK